MRELTYDELRGYETLRKAEEIIAKCAAELGLLQPVDPPDTKCAIPHDVSDSLDYWLSELQATQERILGRTESYDIADARRDAECYERDMERGCDA